MNHAFLIQAHNYPELLADIVNLMSAPNHYFFIHIDKKATIYMHSSQAIKQLKLNPNVIFIERTINVHWGGMSQFMATFNLMEAVNQFNIKFDFIHLLSGQDYPLKNNTDFDIFFEQHRCYSFFGIADNPTQYKNRIELFYLNDLNIESKLKRYLNSLSEIIQKQINKYIKLRPEFQYTLYKGSNWWSITYEMFEYIMNFINKNPQYLKRFKYTNCCDEIFFHTIVFNSPLSKKIIKTNLRFIDWTPRYPKEHVPRILDSSYWTKLENSNAVFCRKLHPKESKKLIDLIKNNIFHTN